MRDFTRKLEDCTITLGCLPVTWSSQYSQSPSQSTYLSFLHFEFVAGCFLLRFYQYTYPSQRRPASATSHRVGMSQNDCLIFCALCLLTSRSWHPPTCWWYWCRAAPYWYRKGCYIQPFHRRKEIVLRAVESLVSWLISLVPSYPFAN